MDVEISQRVPSFNFFGIVRFFRKMIIFILSIFWCFAAEWMLKNPKGSPFQFFGIVRLFLIFFLPRVPSSISLIFYNRMDAEKSQIFPQRFPSSSATEMLTISKGSPFLARPGLALAGPRASFGPFFCFSSTLVIALFLLFLLFLLCKCFCYFWALDVEPTYAVPGLLIFTLSLDLNFQNLLWLIWSLYAWWN